ncbi:hypothetical protein ABZS88_28825 [Streptomyces sp. NPDC005480]|uniref:hypothetical protein n=1 Tax=Streptomyces sp. NPDC005480 TaxID=3154880 RepID=UPI0033B3BF77
MTGGNSSAPESSTPVSFLLHRQQRRWPPGQPSTVTLRQLPRGQRARRVFTVVRRGRAEYPAVLACRKAVHRAVTVRSSHA